MVGDEENEAGDRMDTDSVSALFKPLVQESLCLVTTVAKAHGAMGNKPNTVRFWKSQLAKTYEILDKVGLSLMTCHLRVIQHVRCCLCTMDTLGVSKCVLYRGVFHPNETTPLPL